MSPAPSAEARAVQGLIGLLRRAKPAAFKDVRFGPVREVKEPGFSAIRLELVVAGRALSVDLMPPGSAEPCFLRTRRFRVVPRRTGRALSVPQQRRLALLARLIDRGLEKAHIPAS
ncbi:MAG: hypothetical protein NTY77_18020 [Elusimicrobia bacterium]|nr:hypothetical protein [Elusimicrobiota bacterium]